MLGNSEQVLDAEQNDFSAAKYNCDGNELWTFSALRNEMKLLLLEKSACFFFILNFIQVYFQVILEAVLKLD